MSRILEILACLFRALPYAAAVLLPCALPLVVLTFAVDKPGGTGTDLKVKVMEQGWEKAFERFSPRKVFQVGLHVSELTALNLEDRTFFTRMVLWGRNLFDRSLNDRSELATDELRVINSAELTSEPKAVRAVEGSPTTTQFVSYVSSEQNGTLRANFRLERFPFDSQRLKFVIEPRSSTAEDLLLSVDPASSLNGDVDVGEWDVRSFEATSGVRVARSDYSDPALISRGALWNYVPRVTFTVTLQRRLFAHLLKDLLPLLIIMLMAYSIFFIEPAQFDARCSIAVTSLLSVLALHWSVRSDLPGVAYLTAMDQFFLVSYSLVLLVTVESVITARVCPPEGEEPPAEPHPWLTIGLPLLQMLFPLTLVVGWLWVALAALH